MKVYENMNVSDLSSLLNSSVVDEIPCQNGYFYDHSVFKRTIVTEVRFVIVIDVPHLLLADFPTETL